jgi:hypothetical protein
MGSGGHRCVRGSFKGTGSALNVDTVGGRPILVKLFNLTTNIMLEWQDSMGDASGRKTVAAGTRTNITSAGITPRANGFALGTDSINTSGNEIHYEAWL